MARYLLKERQEINMNIIIDFFAGIVGIIFILGMAMALAQPRKITFNPIKLFRSFIRKSQIAKTKSF